MCHHHPGDAGTKKGPGTEVNRGQGAEAPQEGDRSSNRAKTRITQRLTLAKPLNLS